MANIYDEIDPPSSSPSGGGNIYDQIDPPRPLSNAGGGGNIYDQIDPRQADEEERRRRYLEDLQRREQERQAPPPEAEGMLATGLRAFAHEAPVAAAGAAGAAAGAGLGSIVPGVGTLAGGVAGAIAGGYAGSAAEDASLKLLGADDSVQRAVNAKTNPWSSAIGQGLAQIAGFGAGAAGKAARIGGAAIGGGLEAGQQIYQGEFDPARLATQTAAGAAFTKPYGWGTRLEEAGAQAAGRLGERLRRPAPEERMLSAPGTIEGDYQVVNPAGQKQLDYHGAAAPQASAGVAEEHIAPRKDQDIGFGANSPGHGSEVEGYVKPTPTEATGQAPVTEPSAAASMDPALQAAVDAKLPPKPPPEAPTVPPEAPTEFGAKLDAQFPRAEVPETQLRPMQQERRPPFTVPAEDARVTPDTGIPDFLRRGPNNEFPTSPREAIEAARARGETVDAALRQNVMQRGRSGRPLETAPMDVRPETGDRILTRGEMVAGQSPQGPPPPEMQAMARKPSGGKIISDELQGGRPPTPEEFNKRLDETVGSIPLGGRKRGQPPDTVRFYHGGDDPTSGGPRWVTPDENYARNFRAGEQPNQVHYVDIPRSKLGAGFDEINKTYQHFEAPEEIAKQLKPLRPPGEVGPEVDAAVARALKSPEKISPAATPVDKTGTKPIVPTSPEEAARMAETVRQAQEMGSREPSITPATETHPAVANIPPETPAANQGQAAAKAALAGGGGGAPPPGKPPGGGGAGAPPPQPPRPQLVAEGKLGDDMAMKAARQADNDLHKLSTMPAGEQYPLRDLTREAAKIHPEIKGKGDQQVYNALETGTFDQLPKKLQEAYGHVATYLDKKIDAIRKDLVERGKIEDEPQNPNYVHRMVKNVPSRERINVDPLTEGRLPGITNPSSLHELAFHGAEAKDGSRLVLSGTGERVSVMKDRQIEGSIKRPDADEPLKPGDKITYNGKEYTVDRGRTAEIEQHATHADGTPVEYHKSAVASKIAQYREMKARQDYYNWIDNFKGSESPFKSYMTRDAKEAEKRGWGKSEIPDLDGLYFHPNLGQVLHNNYNPGLNIMGADYLRAINQFAVRSIFWNPVPHSMNALAHYIVARGGDWNPFFNHPVERYRTFAKSIWEGFEAAYTQNGLLQDMNRQGASLVMSKIDSHDLIPSIGRLLEQDLRSNPGKWEQWARDHGLGKGIDGVKLWYDGAQRALWTFSDALMASRIRELEMLHGMTREQAIEHARIHMPDYRLPVEFLGSKSLVNAMADNRISVFGRYHMGMLNSLSHMTTKLLGPNATMDERKEALGNVLALTVLGFVVKPAFDKILQAVTGNEKAEFNPRGPLGPITHTTESLMGKKDVGQTLSNIFTFSPAVKQITQTLANRDFAGRKIVEPGSPLYKKAAQYAEYTAGNVVSPYATFGPTIQPGTSKRGPLGELATQVTDTKVPTEKQVRGKRYGEIITRREAKQREKKPRGLIEYLTP